MDVSFKTIIASNIFYIGIIVFHLSLLFVQQIDLFVKIRCSKSIYLGFVLQGERCKGEDGWHSDYLLGQRMFTYHGNLICKTCKSPNPSLSNSKSCIRLWCPVPPSHRKFGFNHVSHCKFWGQYASCKNTFATLS